MGRRGQHRGRRRLSPARCGGGLLVVAAVALMLGTSSTLSSWSSARSTNNGNQAGTVSVATTHTYASGTCAGSVGVLSRTCPPALGTSAVPPTSLSDTITNTGTSALTQSVTGASCDVVALANAAAATDPMLPRFGVGFGRADPWGGSAAITLAGAGYASDAVGTTGSGLLGLLTSSYSVGVWFRATDALGGGLISLSSSASNATLGWANPAVWIDTAGKVNAAITTTLGRAQVKSSTAYSSGWHHAVLTVATGTLTAVATLYVDGASQGSTGGLTLLTGTSGYWHLGWADFTGLTAPSSATFHGSLAGGFVNRTTDLTAAQVLALAQASTPTAYRSLALAGGASSLWMLGDSGATTIGSGVSLPAAIGAPCGQVQIGFVFSSPASTIATSTLAAFANGVPRSVAAPAIGQSQTLVISLSRAAGFLSDAAGLHLAVPISFSVTSTTAPTWSQTLVWSADPEQVFWA